MGLYVILLSFKYVVLTYNIMLCFLTVTVQNMFKLFILILLACTGCAISAKSGVDVVYRDPEPIRDVIEASKADVYVYYQEELKLNKNIGGEFLFGLVILPSGHVEKVWVERTDFASERLASNILSVISKLEFGELNTVPKTVLYRFNFVPPPPKHNKAF